MFCLAEGRILPYDRYYPLLGGQALPPPCMSEQSGEVDLVAREDAAKAGQQ
jgi:hypothetical protein